MSPSSRRYGQRLQTAQVANKIIRHRNLLDFIVQSSCAAIHYLRLCMLMLSRSSAEMHYMLTLVDLMWPCRRKHYLRNLPSCAMSLLGSLGDHFVSTPRSTKKVLHERCCSGGSWASRADRASRAGPPKRALGECLQRVPVKLLVDEMTR